LAAALIQPLFLMVAMAALFGVVVINRKLYLFFFRQKGILFAAAGVSLHFLYYLYSGLSYVYAWAEFQLKRAATMVTPVAPKY
jgi:Ni/Fe-hydrogenase subunit HybB-like protein